MTVKHGEIVSAAGATRSLPLLGAHAVRSAERRLITVMFVDIVDSTAMIERMDPEDFSSLVHNYTILCDRLIRQFGGYLDRMIGDGLLAFFGLPHAHENDPERAVLAGLAILKALRGERFPTSDGRQIRLNVRAAVNTGAVVVRYPSGGTPEKFEVLGSSVNVAARLQGIAASNSLVIGLDTFRIVQRAFRCRNLGEYNLKGFQQPIRAWRVDRAVERESRFDHVRTGPLTPMVGRNAERNDLTKLWANCVGGNGGVLELAGESGIGKSRLIKAFRDDLPADGIEIMSLQCSPFYANIPLAVEIERLRRVGGLRQSDGAERTLSKLRSLLARAIDRPDIALPYYGAILSIPAFEGYEPADLSSPSERRRAMQTMIDVVISLSRKTPTLIVVEDIQWIDPSSIEFCRLLAERVRGERILLILTRRADYEARWMSGWTHQRMSLGKLSPHESAQMVSAVAGRTAIPRKVVSTIVERTDGVPLFIEEFTRTVTNLGAERDGAQNAGAISLPEPLVPASIQASLMERLDSLGEAKGAAQIASIFGRHFDGAAVAALTPSPPDVLDRHLETLERAGIVHRTREARDDLFVFNHAMIQEAAYDTLLNEERRALHARAADWLLQGGPIHRHDQPAVLAYHFERAGRDAEAVEAWLCAGRSALRRTATKEAVAHLREGIALVERLPRGASRRSKEISLNCYLAMASTAVSGWTGPNVYPPYKRALGLCRRHGPAEEKVLVLWGVTIAEVTNCQLARARSLAREFVQAAREGSDEDAKLMANFAEMLVSFYSGKLQKARAEATSLFDRYDPVRRSKLLQAYQHDPKVVALVYLGHIEWILGRPARARSHCEEARRLATEGGHPFMICYAHVVGASDHLYDRDYVANLECIETGMEMAEEYGYPLYKLIGPLWATSAMVARGPAQHALDRLCGVHSKMPPPESYIHAALYQIMLAEEFGRVGDVEKARALAASAEAVISRTGERWFEPEIYRVQASLARLDPGRDHAAAYAFYQRALRTARKLNAVGWEMRTSVDLASLFLEDGKTSKAREALVAALCKYEPEEATFDIRAARKLLSAICD